MLDLLEWEIPLSSIFSKISPKLGFCYLNFPLYVISRNISIVHCLLNCFEDFLCNENPFKIYLDLILEPEILTKISKLNFESPQFYRIFAEIFKNTSYVAHYTIYIVKIQLQMQIP